LIVIDASAAVVGLLRDGDARRELEGDVAVPHLADSEVAHALRGMTLRGAVRERDTRLALDRWSRLGLSRFPARALWMRVWELRGNLTAYDATYVALAEALDCSLVTADTRLSAATGPRCAITTLRG
jgi:predicted nucleic acid-binding protein